MTSTQWRVVRGIGGPQDDRDLWYAGGLPRLPAGVPLPRCTVCDNPQVFFFSVAFPDDGPWAGRSLAVFECGSCWRDHAKIPDAWPGAAPVVRRTIHLFNGYLEAYQHFFRFVVAPTARSVLRTDYRPILEFERWSIAPEADPTFPGTKLLGTPTFPPREGVTSATYHGHPLVFLMQLAAGETFRPLAGAPPKETMERDALRKIGQEPDPAEPWQLFMGTALWMFGTIDDDPLIWAVAGPDDE